MATSCPEETERRERWRDYPLPSKMCIECEELSLKNSHEQAERPGKNQTLRRQKEPCGWGLLQLTEGSLRPKPSCPSYRRHRAHTLQSCGKDFGHLHMYWESTKANCRQSRRLLQCMEDSFLSQVIAQPEGTQHWI